MYLAIDPTRCTGCRICEVFCSFRKEGVVQPSRSRITVVRGQAPGVFLPFTCQQCSRPLCAEVCPVQAISRNAATQAMVVDVARCLGCKMCVLACPFGGMAWAGSTEPNGARGHPIKCDLCQGNPECAHMCPTGAVRYVAEGREAAARRRAGLGRLPGLLDLVEERGVSS